MCLQKTTYIKIICFSYTLNEIKSNFLKYPDINDALDRLKVLMYLYIFKKKLLQKFKIYVGGIKNYRIKVM